MEKDFLRLGSRNAPITAKEEETSYCSKDAVEAPTRAIGFKRPFASRVSATSHFLSFQQSSLEDRPRKSSNDHLLTSGFMPTSVTDAFDSTQKPPYSTSQSMQPFDPYTVRRTQEVRMLPTSNQRINVSTGVPSLRSHLLSGGMNIINHTINTQPLEGVPIMASPVSALPASSSDVGTTDIRSAYKPLAAPARLTIFYAGTVCVYDDVSPENAQAVMLLAGNGSKIQNKALPTGQVQSPVAHSPVSGGYIGSSSPATTSCSPLSSPVSTISYFGSQSGPISSCHKELPTVKTALGLSFSCSQTQSPKVSCSVDYADTGPTVALPQARKASLARFLEKRKERITSPSPYSFVKKFADYGTTGSECIS